MAPEPEFLACCVQELLFPDALSHLPGQARAKVRPLQQAPGRSCSGSEACRDPNLTAPYVSSVHMAFQGLQGI